MPTCPGPASRAAPAVTERESIAQEVPGVAELPGPAQERREQGERRKYSRRGIELMAPPYHQTFERIAVALERIETLLRERPSS